MMEIGEEIAQEQTEMLHIWSIVPLPGVNNRYEALQGFCRNNLGFELLFKTTRLLTGFQVEVCSPQIAGVPFMLVWHVSCANEEAAREEAPREEEAAREEAAGLTLKRLKEDLMLLDRYIVVSRTWRHVGERIH